MRESSVKISRRNSSYLDIQLTDGSRTIRAKMWDYSGDPFRTGTVVKVSGTGEEYAGRLDLVLSEIRVAEEGECDPSLFLPVHPDREALWQRLLDLINGIKDTPLRQFLEFVFKDKRVSKLFVEAPGGKHHHHSCIGGLLCHTVSVAETCLKLAARRDVDADMLVAGALVHDIGKIDAYDWSGAVFEMTDSGRLLGHIALGLMLLNDFLTFSPHDLSEDRQAELLHMVLSHHGSRDKGSPVEPLTLEAEILHYADELDFKADRIGRAKAEAGEGSRWTDKIRVLGDRSYYLGSRPPVGSLEKHEEETAVAEERGEIWEEEDPWEEENSEALFDFWKKSFF